VKRASPRPAKATLRLLEDLPIIRNMATMASDIMSLGLCRS
jgi:hypothetical protein